MPVASLYTFLTEQDLISRLSSEGVSLRLDDDGDGMVDPVLEQPSVADVISDASETICYYTWMKYNPALLGTIAWVNRRAVDLGAWILCGRRGNPIPDSVQQKADAAQKLLEEIRDGSGLIPFAPLRRRLAPVWSNCRVVLGYEFKCIRVEQQTSAPPPTAYPQNVDWASEFCYEI